MLPEWVVLASLAYAALLFTVAWLGDRYPLYPQRPWLRSAVYSLALAVYCSSWTFYGAVGSAVRHGIGYLPIYLGPLLMFLFGWRIIERLAFVARTQSTVSIADFIASRYGRSQRLAALITLIALIAAIPYLALQYKAVAISLEVLTGAGLQRGPLGDPALYVAALMVVFAILFGTRQVNATEHRPGLMLAVALESLVKLVALVAVGVSAVFWMRGNNLPLVEAARTLITSTPPTGFLAQTLLAFAAIVCLPRQFHVAIVECVDVADVRRARWLFGAYLLIVSLMVLPIAISGIALFAPHSSVAPDSFVLALPLSQDNVVLALIAYIGGFSAATGMIIVASVALATMVSNDLVMPIMLRRGWLHDGQASMASTVLWIRRVAIGCLAGLAYGYYRVSGSDMALASFGLMAFAAVGQFGPALIGGLYWRSVSRQGVEAGLLVGFALWLYTLLLPSLTEAGWMDDAWLQHGPFGLEWLRPYQLFGLEGWDPLTHGVFWSLLFNISTLLIISAKRRPSLGERLRAEPFLNPYAQRRSLAATQWESDLLVLDLQALAGRVLGENAAQRAFADQAAKVGVPLDPGLRADGDWLHFSELLLASAVGASSARVVLTSALKGSGMEVTAVMAVLDEAGPELRFNRDILLATLEHIDQGISVVDSKMRLVAWNQRYLQMFNYPSDMLYVGRSVADLIRFNAERGELGVVATLDIETEIAKRIAYMRAGSRHIFERTLRTGQVIALRGRPLPGGGYVTTYSDVTDYKHAEHALRDINETLEQRVAERTHEAEQAHETRAKFLAAISHDVLQPINAARLFTSALREADPEQDADYLAERIDTSLRAAEELLDGLLDMSRLDASTLQPELSNLDISQMLTQLAEQYRPMAASRQLALRVCAPRLFVRSDRRLLQRMLQNFLSNALRYTRSGGVLLTARTRADHVLLQVWDTGPGIPPHHLRQIYDEFHRYEQPFDWDGRGLGLGLSICQRISSRLSLPLAVRSVVGKGSVFSVLVPRAADADPVAAPAVMPPALAEQLQGLKVLCLDNDQNILEGMRILLQRWQVQTLCATTVDQAMGLMTQAPDIVLADYHLHDRLNGLDALDVLSRQAPDIVGALLTADGSAAVKQAARERGYRVLTKPVKPASLRAFLAASIRRA